MQESIRVSASGERRAHPLDVPIYGRMVELSE